MEHAPFRAAPPPDDPPTFVPALGPKMLQLASTFFFNDTATTEIYTLSLHDALPNCCRLARCAPVVSAGMRPCTPLNPCAVSTKKAGDRKSTRLNSSHVSNLVCR